MKENRYIVLKDLVPLLPFVKNQLLIVYDNGFKVFKDKTENEEINFSNITINELAFSILKNCLSDKELFFQIEEAKFTKTDLIDFNNWYNSEDGDRIFPNENFISDAIDYWESNVKGATVYATVLN